LEDAPNVSLDDYLSMIEGKTASLLAASCAIGALLAGAETTSVEQFYEFGRRLGLAFQVQDDILGCWGDASETGKSSADDIRAGKRSYPIVIAFERASRAQRDRLSAVLGDAAASDADIGVVRGLLEELGAREDGERAARDHADAAIEALRRLALGDQRVELEALARFAAERSA
jgi:geranylgeranyl pyrophosphate synthase